MTSYLFGPEEGRRCVVVNEQRNGDGSLLVWANLYVNCAPDRGLGDHARLAGASITHSRWQGKTARGAARWAEGKLKPSP